MGWGRLMMGMIEILFRDEWSEVREDDELFEHMDFGCIWLDLLRSFGSLERRGARKGAWRWIAMIWLVWRLDNFCVMCNYCLSS